MVQQVTMGGEGGLKADMKYLCYFMPGARGRTGCPHTDADIWSRRDREDSEYGATPRVLGPPSAPHFNTSQRMWSLPAISFFVLSCGCAILPTSLTSSLIAGSASYSTVTAEIKWATQRDRSNIHCLSVFEATEWKGDFYTQDDAYLPFLR